MAEKNDFRTDLTTTLQTYSDGLPQGFNITRFANNAMALLKSDDMLSKFVKQNPGTGLAEIKSGLLKGSYLGLDALNKEFYLIPYGNKINFQIDYRGCKKIAKKYAIRPIKDIFAKLVREGDEFEEALVGGESTINFKPKPFNNAPIIGAFAVCIYKDGGMEYDTMSIDELEQTRKHSKASNSMAWKDFTGEMYKKTVLRRLCKHIEIDFENPSQYEIYSGDAEIETDVFELSKNEIEENANKEEFVYESDEVIIDE